MSEPTEAAILAFCATAREPRAVVDEFCAALPRDEAERAGGLVRLLVRRLIDAGRLDVTLDWKLRTRREQ
jgi:hypothetical protein